MSKVIAAFMNFTDAPALWDDVTASIERYQLNRIVKHAPLPRPPVLCVRDVWGVSRLPAPTQPFVSEHGVFVLTTEDGDFLIDARGTDHAAHVARITDDVGASPRYPLEADTRGPFFTEQIVSRRS